MKVTVSRKVRSRWGKLSERERRVVRAFAKGSPKALTRGHCKIVLSLVQGSTPTRTIQNRRSGSSSRNNGPQGEIGAKDAGTASVTPGTRRGDHLLASG